MGTRNEDGSPLYPILIVVAFIAGLLTTSFILPAAKILIIRQITHSQHGVEESDRRRPDMSQKANPDSLYGLDHAVLNMGFAPKTMWMSMGYWKDTDGVNDLVTACEALLERILDSAGIDVQNGKDKEDSRVRKTKSRRVLLDLGFGCGEQTIYMMVKNASKNWFDEYIGITLDKIQCDYARKRINQNRKEQLHPKQDGCGSENENKSNNIHLFCADGARPQTWPQDLNDTISSKYIGCTDDDDGKEPYDTDRYVLGLDSFYHFHPSRKEIFKYTYSTLHAHILAFDIFLAPPSHQSSSFPRNLMNRLFLRILTPALGAPFSNFITPDGYKAQLEEVGYAAENISIEDITDHVFAGLAHYLETRHQELTALGLSGFAKWQVAGWLFKWLSKGDILRAGIVVAKSK
ncbi:hypothetical protein FQN57_002644 [Myotisia sp. PD_48]|nr:hypothetical protein FQN57_002644 [Myotisia sp. PD_48]